MCCPFPTSSTRFDKQTQQALSLASTAQAPNSPAASSQSTKAPSRWFCTNTQTPAESLPAECLAFLHTAREVYSRLEEGSKSQLAAILPGIQNLLESSTPVTLEEVQVQLEALTIDANGNPKSPAGLVKDLEHKLAVLKSQQRLTIALSVFSVVFVLGVIALILLIAPYPAIPAAVVWIAAGLALLPPMGLMVSHIQEYSMENAAKKALLATFDDAVKGALSLHHQDEKLAAYKNFLLQCGLPERCPIQKIKLDGTLTEREYPSVAYAFGDPLTTGGFAPPMYPRGLSAHWPTLQYERELFEEGVDVSLPRDVPDYLHTIKVLYTLSALVKKNRP